MAAAQFPIGAAGRRDPIRDYLVGSTHRKDAISGALWDRLRDQLHARDPAAAAPAMTGRRSQVFAGTGMMLAPAPGEVGAPAAATLSAMLAQTLGAIRWEPLNPTTEHRPCASPGSRFAVEAVLAVATSQSAPASAGITTFRYLPRDHALVIDPDPTPGPTPNLIPAAISPDTIAITLTADLSRCATPYGDLAYCLVVIELGAVLAQLALVAGEHGLRLDAVAGDAGSATGAAMTMPRIVAHIVAPSIAGWLREAPRRAITAIDDAYPRFPIGDFPLTAAMMRALPTAPSTTDRWPAGLAARWSTRAPVSIAAATAGRSSGRYLRGESRTDPPAEANRAREWLDLVAAIHGSVAGLERHGVRIDIRSPDPAIGAGIDATAMPPQPASGSTLVAARAAPDDRPAWGYSAPRGATIVTVSGQYRAYRAAFGTTALFHLHLAAGIACQAIGLASAAVGLVCRPMRSFDHAAVDATLPVDHWSVLQLVVWREAAINPGYRTIDLAEAIA